MSLIPPLEILKKGKNLDLQAKVFFILVMVILPISFAITLAQSKFMAPLLYDEIRQVGVSFAQNLASQIDSNHLLTKSNANALLEDRIQRMLYSQPSVLRVDIFGVSPVSPGSLIYLASSVEDSEGSAPPITTLVDQLTVDLSSEDGIPVWNILYPLKAGAVKANIHVLVSVRFVNVIQNTILRINLVGALISTIFLIFLLSFFLRRAIENEKQLKVAQQSNEVLSVKLQEIQQQLIHKERLAVMGQLTASFAHEIGTPLNAIGGHMQLLNMDLEKSLSPQALKTTSTRMEIIIGQLKKIELIVKGFLKTTKTPVPEQRTLTSVRTLIERVLLLVTPTLQSHQIVVKTDFTLTSDQVEVVPIEIEQVILNLFNNATDSMKDRSESKLLQVRTKADPQSGTVSFEVQDSGSGITEENLKRIFKPFFTTKTMGEGHGLGLSICQEIIRSYGGEILVESRLNEGTMIRVQLPLKGVNA